MKFKLVDRLEVNRKVTVKVPRDGTGFQDQSFTARFCILDKDAADDLAVRAGDDFALLDEVLVGLPDGIDTEDGHLDDSPELRQRLVKVPYVRLALIHAYTDAQMGIERKNS